MLECFFNSPTRTKITSDNIMLASNRTDILYVVNKIDNQKFFEENGLEILSSLSRSAKFDGIIEEDLLNCFISRMIEVAEFDSALEQCIKSIHEFSYLDGSYGWKFAEEVFVPSVKKELNDRKIIAIFDKLLDENNPKDYPGYIEAAKNWLQKALVLTLEENYQVDLNGEDSI